MLRIEHTIQVELKDSERKQLEQIRSDKKVEDVEKKADVKMQDDHSQAKYVKISTEEKPLAATGVDLGNKEVKGESAMLQLLMDYVTAAEPTSFEFVKGDPSTCSKAGQWLV